MKEDQMEHRKKSLLFDKNPFEIWYDLNKEASMTLKPQTSYFYKFYAVVNGQEYYSGVKSFTSGGRAAVPVVTPEVTQTAQPRQ